MMHPTENIRHFLRPGVRVHMAGIGGVSMCALAEVLKGMGLNVQGSDMTDSDTVKHLRSVGIPVTIGHSADNLQNCDLVIRTAAIHDSNPEIAGAIARGIPVYERAQGWGAIMQAYRNALCVSGTHGKTTTTSMATHIFMAAQKDPTVMIGGTLPLLGKGYRVGKGDTIILESCEYCNSFLNFFPIFVLGAIYGGICTPSEAAAVSVFYAAFVGLFVYKKINFKDCVQIFVKTCCTAGVCGFMVFCVSMVSRIFMVENLNGAVEALLNAMGGNRYVILLCVNILLILFGMFLDDSSAMYICAPILTPVLANFGIDPVHFAAIMIVNLGLGCITPPCASVLFMGARVGKSSLTKMLPSTYSLILFVWLPMLAILTLFPNVALWLPRVMLGYGA